MNGKRLYTIKDLVERIGIELDVLAVMKNNKKLLEIYELSRSPLSEKIDMNDMEQER